MPHVETETKNKVSRYLKKNQIDVQHTPFIRGMSDAGSVDIDASSRKTTGKSVTFNATHAEVMHVVQI